MQAVSSVQPSIADPAASPADLEGSIGRATEAILALQREDGHWVFELEADATIPAEYVLLKHFLGEPADLALEAKIAAISGASRAPMAAGRCSMRAPSTSAPA